MSIRIFSYSSEFSTNEFIIFFLDVGEWEPESVGDSSARIWCPDLLHEGQWHHLVIVLNRAVLKNSSFSLFLDGHVSCKINNMYKNRTNFLFTTGFLFST